MIKKLKWIIAFLFILVLAIITIANNKIEKSTNGLVYNDLIQIPNNKVGLLLGTAKLLKSGQPSPYFTNRIKATVDLFHACKIDFIVASGDNRKKDNDEPLDMKNELIKLGIPENKIFLDYGGFRTYESVIRLNKVFGQRKFTIVSQDFHNRRAIFISQHMDLQAIGFNAKDVDSFIGFKARLREKLARVKVFIDFMIKKEPKSPGQQIEIK
jgi:SanA protein